ncbi:MAG: NUDIX domain-containing protein [Candidatus Andersenbacteria bacterium]
MNQVQPPNLPPKPLPPVPPPVRPLQLRRKSKLKASTHPPRRRGGKVRAGASHLPIRKELSAGGVVLRQEGSQWLVALLKTEHKRGEVWVLPKGHVELQSGERVSDAARREVQEEAGLTDLSVKNQLGVTRFRFQVEDALVYKTVHYFLMITQQKTLTPQADEGLLEAAWFPIEEAIKALEYDTDQDIVQRALARVTGQAPTRVRQQRPRPRSRRSRIHT